MYSEKKFIDSIETSPNLELKISSIFKYFQIVGANHINAFDIGMTKTIQEKKRWIITHMLIEINRLPKFEETVNVITYPGKDMKFLFPRYYVIEDINNNALVKCSSIWAIMDEETRKICLRPFGKFSLPEEHMDGELPLPKKIVYSDGKYISSRKVNYSDIDLNGHLSNVKYIEYVLDLHDMDFYKCHVINKIEINYLKEIKNSDTVYFYKYKKDNVETIVGKVNDEISFVSNISYHDNI